jgi:dinuclear metal center YbgI/SA1388 family protein
MKAKEITSIIEEFAPLQFQERWDNSGYCIGSPEQEVHSALIGLDCTPELVDEAIRCGADMIITHHPLIFGGVAKINPETNLGYMIYKAIRHGIVVYSCHTNMDKVLDGVSGLMASRLALEDVAILDKGDSDEGLGVVGTLPSPMLDEEFARVVKERFSLKCLRCSRPTGRVITRVALCGGAGKSLLSKAIAAGADAYITGDVSYHDFLTEKGFFLMDIGHYEGEIDIVRKISDLLKEKIPTFAVRLITENNNLVHYI